MHARMHAARARHSHRQRAAHLASDVCELVKQLLRLARHGRLDRINHARHVAQRLRHTCVVGVRV
jgi:hypothetical protein